MRETKRWEADGHQLRKMLTRKKCSSDEEVKTRAQEFLMPKVLHMTILKVLRDFELKNRLILVNERSINE